MKLFLPFENFMLGKKNISVSHINKKLGELSSPDFNSYGEHQCFLWKIAKV